MNENTDPKFIAAHGYRCPAFVANAVIEDTPSDHLHSVTIADVTILMTVTEDGGIVTYDDGVTIYRRVFDDMDEAIETFRDTVDVTIDEYRHLGREIEPTYSEGNFTVKFDNID